MAKSDRVLSFFPAFYRATERTKLLYEVVRVLAQPLEEADTDLFRIQRAHRLLVAGHTEDILRLAAALHLTAFHFEDLLTDDTLEYDRQLVLMRERVQRVARVHLQGLGTPWAVMESTAIFLRAAIVPEHPGDPLIKHVDAGLFSHKSTIAFPHLPQQPRASIYLHENPLRRQKVEPAERWPMQTWAIDNQNVEVSPVRFAIQGVNDRTVLPSIFCPDTEESILFNGIVPEGKTLVIDADNGATIDALPVDEWLVHFRGGIYDFSRVPGSAFVTAPTTATAPFDGALDRLTPSPFRQKRPVPTARHGRSAWYFKVATGVYDDSTFDYAVYVTPAEPIGTYDGDTTVDACVFDFPASGVVGMAWDERIPCAFKLVLPPHVAQLHRATAVPLEATAGQKADAEPSNNYVGRIASLLPRFKPAGIRAFVDTARDAWILGTSVLRSASAGAGEGVAFQATRLQNPKVDIFVPFDTTSSSSPTHGGNRHG